MNIVLGCSCSPGYFYLQNMLRDLLVTCLHVKQRATYLTVLAELSLHESLSGTLKQGEKMVLFYLVTDINIVNSCCTY